ncbi:MAG: hypothetical protein IPG25_14620 [Proteobacteria bacterium]|nr:hypothetical protein [Pseudomonadota bacterium]
MPDQPPVSLPQRTTRTPPAVANAGARQPTPIKAPAVAAWAPRMDSGQVDSAAAAAAAAAAQAIYADKTPSSPARHFDVRLPLAIATAVAAAALVGYLLLRRETPAAVTSPQVSTPAIVSIPEQVTTPAPLPSDASASVASAVGAAVAVEDPRIATLQTAIEAALTRDDLTAASQALGELTRLVPQHPRLAFLTAAIQRTRDGRKRASVTTPAAATLPTLTQFTGRTLEESRTPQSTLARGRQRSYSANATTTTTTRRRLVQPHRTAAHYLLCQHLPKLRRQPPRPLGRNRPLRPLY